MKTVELDDKAAEALVFLRARAEQNQLHLDQLLLGIAETLSPAQNGGAVASEDWERELDELAAESDSAMPLARDFSRSDIYDEHD